MKKVVIVGLFASYIGRKSVSKFLDPWCEKLERESGILPHAERDKSYYIPEEAT